MQIKKVAFFTTSLNSGGIENYLLRFLQYAQNKFQATVYCKSGTLGDLQKEYLEVGACLIPYRLKMLSPICYYKLFKTLKFENFDAVVDFTGNFAALPLLAAKKAGIAKRIVFYRGASNHFKEDFLRLKYNNYLNSLIPKTATSILSNSEAALNFFFEKKWKTDSRFKVIYNGIDINTFLTTKEDLREELNIPLDAFVVGHVGRFNTAKNHDSIIDVAIQMCNTDGNIYFVLCGKDTDAALVAKVKEVGLQNQIKLLGLRKDVIRVLNTLDCFYFPSISEGQPNALIEAMAVGLPFVASNIASIKETVPVEFHEQLVPPLDIITAVEKINEIKSRKDILKFDNLSSEVAEIYNSESLFKKFYKEL